MVIVLLGARSMLGEVPLLSSDIRVVRRASWRIQRCRKGCLICMLGDILHDLLGVGFNVGLS